MTPQISVIMPVYNSGRYLREAIESILNQTFRDFEFFIIDDASTDNSVEIVRSYTDERIILIEKPVNTGYTESLNFAIPRAKGVYIARMDSDDIAMPHRFECQHLFMETNPDILLVGTAYEVIDGSFVYKPPIGHEEVKLTALLEAPVAHPSVFMRREIFTTHQLQYNKQFEPTEDFDLWTRVLEHGKIDNLSEVLLRYRHHAAQESKTKVEKVLAGLLQIRTRQLGKLITFGNKKYDASFVVKVLSKEQLDPTPDVLIRIIEVIHDLYNANRKLNLYDKKLFFQYLQQRWLHYVAQFYQPSAQYYKVLFLSGKCEVTKLGYNLNKRFLKQVVKGLLKIGQSPLNTSLK